jgi:hypothetical protein
MADPRYNPGMPPSTRVVTSQAITTNVSGWANFAIPLRRVRKAMANYTPIAAQGGTSGDVRVSVQTISGATVVVRCAQMSGLAQWCASGFVLSGGTMTIWAEGDR